jgi:hypothetical protein
MLHALVLKGYATDDRIGTTKCGTEVLGHANELTHSSKDTWRREIQATPPAFDDSVVSGSGKFKVYYFRNDPIAGASREYAQAVARFADEAYDFEIGELGYAKPPFGFADSTYHVYLQPVGASRIYGYTDEVPNGDIGLGFTPSGLRRVRTFVVIDNDFLDSVYVTRGLDGARITVFHEFHHVVQFGSYGRNNAHNYFQEMTSTWMEMLSDPDVEDYIQYVPGFTRGLTLRFDKSPGGGYGQSIYLEYLQSRFGRDIARETWETYRDEIADPVDAIADAINSKNSSFACEYARFGAELFFTGRRSRATSPFRHAGKFIDTLIESQFIEIGEPTSDQVFGSALHIYWTKKDSKVIALAVARDTARLINANIQSLVIRDVDDYDITYDQPQRFCAVSGAGYEDPTVFPQPFVLNGPSGSVFIKIADKRPPVNSFFKILSVSLNEIVTIRDEYEGAGGGYCVKWDGRDATGKPVPSGVYLFVADTDGEERTGKIVVIRK